MQVTRTIKYAWHTISVPYTIACDACGKKYERTASRGHNELATAEDRQRFRDELKAQAVKLASATDFVCDACRKGKLKQACPVQVQELVGLDVIPAISDLLERQAALDEDKKRVDVLFRPLRGRIFLYKGEEYAQASASFCRFEGEFRVDGYRINKRQPWLITDTHAAVTLNDIVYLDDTLDARKAAVKGEAV